MTSIVKVKSWGCGQIEDQHAFFQLLARGIWLYRSRFLESCFICLLAWTIAILIRNQYDPAFSYYSQGQIGIGETSATPVTGRWNNGEALAMQRSSRHYQRIFPPLTFGWWAVLYDLQQSTSSWLVVGSKKICSFSTQSKIDGCAFSCPSFFSRYLVSTPLKNTSSLSYWSKTWNSIRANACTRVHLFESDVQPYPVDHASFTVSCGCSAWRRWLSSEP